MTVRFIHYAYCSEHHTGARRACTISVEDGKEPSLAEIAEAIAELTFPSDPQKIAEHPKRLVIYESLNGPERARFWIRPEIEISYNVQEIPRASRH